MEEQEVTRLPREVVEAYRRPLPQSLRRLPEEAPERRLPGEVVEIYRQPLPGEVVETYARPLPLPRPRRTPPARRKRSGRGLRVFLFGLALAVAATAGSAAWSWSRSSAARWNMPSGGGSYRSPAEGAQAKEISISRFPTGQGAVLSLEWERGGQPLTAQEIYRQVNPSVVMVLVDLGNDSVSVGTGVIFTQDGYILTNHHVVEGGQKCSVALNTGRGYDARYVAGDADSDLAILKVEAQNLPAAVFGDSDFLTVGDAVYAIGNPLGVELRGTLTDGIVSAIDRDVLVEGRTMTLLQTNAALNTGNSGGPLINEYGQVVGINTIKMTSRYSNIEGLGFAIPTSYMERAANDLLTYGALQPEPVLGVSVSQVGEQVEPDLWGILVQTVTEGSPADRAGIQEGDYVLSAGGREIDSSQTLLRVRRQCHLGDELSVTLWRNGEFLEVTLHLMEPVT